MFWHCIGSANTFQCCGIMWSLKNDTAIWHIVLHEKYDMVSCQTQLTIIAFHVAIHFNAFAALTFMLQFLDVLEHLSRRQPTPSVSVLPLHTLNKITLFWTTKNPNPSIQYTMHKYTESVRRYMRKGLEAFKKITLFCLERSISVRLMPVYINRVLAFVFCCMDIKHFKPQYIFRLVPGIQFTIRCDNPSYPSL